MTENKTLEHWGATEKIVEEPKEVVKTPEELEAEKLALEQSKIESESKAKLTELGYTDEDLKDLKPEDITKIVSEGVKKEIETVETVYKLKVGSQEKEIPQKDYDELVEFTINKFGKEKFAALDTEMQTTLIADQYNYKKFNQTANEKSRTIAEEKKELENQKKDWQKEIDEMNAELKTRNDTAIQKQKDYEKKLQDLEEKEKELDKILDKDPDDVIDINDKVSLLTKQSRAEEKKEENKEKKAKYESEIEKLKKEENDINARARGTWIQTQILELQDAFPELSTGDKPVAVLIDEYNTWDESKGVYPYEDLIIKAQRVVSVLDQYSKSLTKDSKRKISDFYKIIKFNYPELPAPPVKKGKINVVELKSENIKDTFKKFLEAKPSDPQTTRNVSTEKPSGKVSREEMKKKTGFRGND